MPINKMLKNGQFVKNKDGLQGYRVHVLYTDINGNFKQVERTCYGLAEAQLMEKQLITDYNEKKEGVSKSRLTINELIEEYLNYHVTEVKPSSLDSISKVLRLRIKPYLGDCRLDKLTQNKLAAWKVAISNEKLSNNTKKNAYAVFTALLNFAVKMQYMSKNPLTILGNFKDSCEADDKPQKIRYYTGE